MFHGQHIERIRYELCLNDNITLLLKLHIISKVTFKFLQIIKISNILTKLYKIIFYLRSYFS